MTEYEQLVEKVRNISEEAAAYMEGPAKELEGFAADGELIACFVFGTTPQGHEFWWEIYKKTLVEV